MEKCKPLRIELLTKNENIYLLYFVVLKQGNPALLSDTVHKSWPNMKCKAQSTTKGTRGSIYTIQACPQKLLFENLQIYTPE